MSLTEVITRLSGLGDASDLPAPLLVNLADQLAGAPGDYARISVDDQKRLSLLARWPTGQASDDLVGYIRSLGNQIQKMTLPAMVDRPAAARFVELEVRAGGKAPTVSVHAVGERALADDLAMLGKATIFKSSAANAVRDAAGTLGRRSSDILIDRAEPNAANLWLFGFRHPVGTGAQLDASSKAALALMDQFRVVDDQRLLFERLHPDLTRAESCTITIYAGFDALLPWLSVRYPALPWDAVVPVMMELYPNGDWSDRLGAFAGAFGAQTCASFELRFRDEHPVRARVSVDWTAG
jgi:hypothetical protein